MAQKIDIKTWMKRFEKAESLQREQAEARKQAIRLYTSSFFGPVTDRSESQEVNFVYEFTDVLVSAVYSRNPHIFVTPEISKWVSFSQTMATILNYYWREKEVKQKMKKVIKDTILQPPGWIGIGFQLSDQVRKARQTLEGEFPELKEAGGKVEAQEGVLDDTKKFGDVFVDYLSSWDVVWPDGYNDIRKAPYIFIIERTNLEDVQNNPLLKKAKFDLRRHVGPTITTKKAENFTIQNTPPPLEAQDNRGSVDLEEVKVKLIHVWDRRGQQMFTLAENFNRETLFGPKKWDLLIDGFPFYPLIFNEVPQTDEKANSYPLSDVTPMMPQLHNLSVFTALMMKHGRRQGGVIIADDRGMDDVQAANLQSSESLDFVRVNDSTKVNSFSYPTVPASWFNLKNDILQDLFRISGLKQLLASGTGVETATESENLREGARLRQGSKIDVVEDLTVSVARGLAGLIWQFIPREQISEIIGEPVSEEMWPSLPTLADGTLDMEKARQIVQKEISFRIDAGSTRPPKDEAVETKLFTDQVAILKEMFPGRFKEEVIVEETLKKMKIPEAEKAVIGFDDEEIQVAQQENELLLQGIPIPVGPNDNHQLHLQVHAQPMQDPGANPTPELDQHIAAHADKLEQQNPQARGGGGNNTINPASVRRRGVPTGSDISGGVQSIRGVGGEKGGR